MLAVTAFPQGQAAAEWVALQGPGGVSASAAGAIFVSYDVFVGLGSPLNGEAIQAFHPATGNPLANPVLPGNRSNPGPLHTLDAIGHLPRWLGEGELLNMQSDGNILAVRPSTGQVGLLIPLRALVPSSVNPNAFQVDNTDIFDVYTMGTSNFGGTVLPPTATYHDLDVFHGAGFSDILVTGVSTLPFVMRVRFINGEFAGAKVLASTSGTSLGGINAPGVAVNDQGVVLTTLGVFENFLNANQAVDVPIAFDVGFAEGRGRAPFRPFPFDREAALPQTTGTVISSGITTDSRGNFIISLTAAGAGVSTSAGIFMATTGLAGQLVDLVFVPFQNDERVAYQPDLAVSPDDQSVFVSTTLRSSRDNSLQQVLRVNMPQLPDLTPLFSPADWERAIVVSTTTGGHADEPTVASTDNVYVDFSIFNLSSGNTYLPYAVSLFMDDELAGTFQVLPGHRGGDHVTFEDIDLGSLDPGDHALLVAVDPLFGQPELNERNNLWVRSFTVEAPPPPELSIRNVTQPEGTGTTTQFEFELRLSRASNDPVFVEVETGDDTAIAGVDYIGLPLSTIVIPAGSTRATVGVTITADAEVEMDERFFVRIVAASNATIADREAVGTILNDDVESPLPGDTNGDGVVDLDDLNNVRNHFGGTGLGDTNGDGIVDIDDLNNVRNNFGATQGRVLSRRLPLNPAARHAAFRPGVGPQVESGNGKDYAASGSNSTIGLETTNLPRASRRENPGTLAVWDAVLQSIRVAEKIDLLDTSRLEKVD